MVEILPDERLQQVMERTLFNLRFVNARAQEQGPFEVVQLVNSFMGAMVHPWEKKSEFAGLAMASTDMGTARRRGWPILERELPSDVEPTSYGRMLEYVRHSFAHGNVAFENELGKIAKVRLWNEWPTGTRVWGSLAPVTELESFLWFFTDLSRGRIPKSKTYYPRIVSYAAD